jgi:hypothetical protein
MRFRYEAASGTIQRFGDYLFLEKGHIVLLFSCLNPSNFFNDIRAALFM